MNIEMLQQDQEFIQKLAHTADAKEVAALFAEKGIAVSEEEARLAMEQAKADGEAELDASALDQVSGGSITVGASLCMLAFLIGYARGSRCK